MDEKKLRKILFDYMPNAAVNDRVRKKIDSFIDFCKKYNINIPLDRIVNARMQGDGETIYLTFKSKNNDDLLIEIGIQSPDSIYDEVAIGIRNNKEKNISNVIPIKFEIHKDNYQIVQYIIKFLEDEYENSDDFIKDVMKEGNNMDKVFSERNNFAFTYFLLSVIHSGSSKIEDLVNFLYENFEGADKEGNDYGVLFDNKNNAIIAYKLLTKNEKEKHTARQAIFKYIPIKMIDIKENDNLLYFKGSKVEVLSKILFKIDFKDENFKNVTSIFFFSHC